MGLVLPRLSGYVGHYMGLPDSWFFVLAESPEDVVALVDGRWGEPDARSLKKVDGPIAFQFRTRVTEDDELVTEADPSPDGATVYFEDEEVEDWMRERFALPFESPADEDDRALDASLGEAMPKEWKRAINGPSSKVKARKSPKNR